MLHMRLFPLWFVLLIFFGLTGCGHKKPPEPFPPPQANFKPNGNASTFTKGVGGYFIGDDGFVILYWDFPVKADLFEVYKGSQLVGKTANYNFLVKEPVKKSTVFKVVAYKDKKPVGEVFIRVNP